MSYAFYNKNYQSNMNFAHLVGPGGILPNPGGPGPGFFAIPAASLPPHLRVNQFPYFQNNMGTMYPSPNMQFAGSPPPGFAPKPGAPTTANGYQNNVGPRLRNQSESSSKSATYEPGYEWTAPPHVLLYIDNSNVFESAKKYSGHKKGYRNSIPDVACRIDIGKLISTAIGTRGLVFGKLYGSEPPALDTVWEAIRRKQVHVETFQRSKWTLKEKETDSSLTADAVEDILTEKDKAGENRTVIIFSGDRDLLRVVDKAVKHGYRVEIWSFKSSINNTVKRRAQDNPDKVVVFNIDDIFDEITYTKTVWGKKTIPRERSLVASVKLAPDSDKKKILTEFVAKAGEIFQLPMMGKYMDNYKYILLVPCIKEHYTPPACPGKPRSEQTTVRTYNFYKHIQPFMHQLHECFDTFCSDVTTFVQFLENRRSHDTFQIECPTRFQHLEIEDDDEESKEDDSEEITDEDLLMSDDESEDFDTDFFDVHHEDIDDDFVPITRKEYKTKRMYSTWCIYKFWCTKGLDCPYKHTEHQKEFFKKESDPKRRRLYKIKLCYHKECQHRDKPYLCAYAHNLEESRCICCKEKGSGKHWMDQCPYNRYATTPNNNNNEK